MTPPLITVAVDPGVNGGIAWRVQGQSFATRMPANDFATVELLEQLSKKATVTEIFIELPPLFAGKNIPGSAIGKLMLNYGVLYGASVAFGFKVHPVRPPVWQKAHPVGTKGELTTTQWKNKLKARASELFPELSVTLNTADALLILDAGLRKAIN